MRKALWVALAVLFCISLAAGQTAGDELKGGFRLPAKNGWTFVHLEGTPHQIGYQHGALLAREIEDTLRVERFEIERDSQKDWKFFRAAAETMMWPRIDPEYREELQGIADGASAKGAKIDLWDVVALNASLEWDYYVKEYDKRHGAVTASKAVAEHCSAFVATGSYTRDHKIVIAHNNWSQYPDGARWTIMFDIKPAKGNRMLMDGLPGVIHSADDFVVNSAGLAITETTIGHFHGYDEKGVPEFVRARKAAQYAGSIDDFASIMTEGNNGGYANAWLVGDTKANEIARLELGLKNVTLERSKDGVFYGANFPINEKLIREETDYNPVDLSQSAAARRIRWEQIMSKEKGKIDVKAAHRFLADHYDTFEKKENPSERTLDGHVELSPRGMGDWVGSYGTAGAVQNKAADARMISEMSLTAAAGHACGKDFRAAEHLAAHPEQAWEKNILIDMKAYPWTKFQIAK
ncbi:MAG: C45 family autoproteolytic acyltransferase/hydrolase [Acidobacteriota bacterium]|nr:C45 family autoproteolytic acyltransferase/hydrolase [Acidobacteriota bacterium]